METCWRHAAGGGTPSRPTTAAWYTTLASDSGPWTRLDVAQRLWQRFCSKVFGMERNWERGCYVSPEMAMDQYLLIPFFVGWTSIYQLFWCSPGVQGFDPSPNDGECKRKHPQKGFVSGLRHMFFFPQRWICFHLYGVNSCKSTAVLMGRSWCRWSPCSSWYIAIFAGKVSTFVLSCGEHPMIVEGEIPIWRYFCEWRNFCHGNHISKNKSLNFRWWIPISSTTFLAGDVPIFMTVCSRNSHVHHVFLAQNHSKPTCSSFLAGKTTKKRHFHNFPLWNPPFSHLSSAAAQVPSLCLPGVRSTWAASACGFCSGDLRRRAAFCRWVLNGILMGYIYIYIYICGNSNPNWLSYFSEG